MSKVRISNAIGTSENDYPGPVTIHVDGEEWGPVIGAQVDTKKLAVGGDTSAAASALIGGGNPGGGYTGGGVGGENPETGQAMRVQDIAFVPGGITKIPYPQGNQKRYRITGVVAGPGCFEFTVGRSKPGIGRFSLVGAEIDACPFQRLVIAREAGVFIGPSIVYTYGAGNHFSETFVVGREGDKGYGPELLADAPSFVNVEFSTGVPTNLICEVAAHDRA